MESESVLSEPSTKAPPNCRVFANNEKSSSIAQLSISSSKSPHTPRVAKLETLEAKMASIEVSLSSTANRRRKSSIGRDSCSKSTISSRSDIAPSRELRSALQDREAVIQNLRLQLGLAKLPRPVGPAFDEVERPAAEKRLIRLKIDAENKRVGIRNLKSAMEKLEISDNSNIDTRIRQAELEYALGRDELQLLSLVEEARAVQSRLEKSSIEAKSMYQLMKSGSNLLLHAVEATPGRWNASIKSELAGFVVDWALDGEGLCRGDRILEVNGKILTGNSREELQKLIGIAGKCELVVLRKHSSSFSNQQFQQTQADNLRLQHRISYLEEHVRELQEPKKSNGKDHQQNGAHVTSISISSPPSTPPEQHKPQIFQRGTYVTAIVGGKAVDPPPQPAMKPALSVQNITKTLIKDSQKPENENCLNVLKNNMKNVKSISTSTISINSDSTMMHKKERDKHEREIRRMEREKYIQQHSNMGKVHRSEDNNVIGRLYHKHQNGSAARSVEHLNSMDRRRISCLHNELAKRNGIDARSVKSLDFESDNGERNVDYTSEPVVQRAGRPTPPKKPIRLSLHRAQSLQTVDGSSMSDYEKKRTLKRAHKTEKANLAMKYIENSLIPNHTSSLGRQKFIEKLIKI